jgi:predicted ATPase/DNA-binding CsgD family transcriptional regulator
MMAVTARTAARTLRADGLRPSGREQELGLALNLLNEPSVRLLTFTGPAGVGKSWTARELTGRLAGHGGCALLVVPVHNAEDIEDLLCAVARALELPVNPAPLAERVPAALGAEPHLVLLDGCERLTGEPHPVEVLLRLCPSARVVATSLSSLRIRAERVVGLDPFWVPPAGAPVEELRRSPAVRLFLAWAARAHRSFDADTADIQTVAELCRRVHGLPLGVEILAARVGAESPADVLQYLDAGQEVVLRRTRSGHDPRHLSLRAALAWSYAMLEPHAARLLRRMSVFAGPATVDMLRTVCAAVPGKEPAARPSYSQVLDLVSTLVDHRLVDPFPGIGEPAFVLVPLLRDFAQEQLVDEGEQGWAEEARIRAVVEYAVERAAGVETGTDSGDDAVVQRELARSDEDLRAVLRTLVGRGDLCDGLRLATALAPYVLRRGYDGFVGSALKSLLRAAAGNEVADSLRGHALSWKARLTAQYEGPIAAADVTATLGEALRLVRQSADTKSTLLALSFVLETVPVTMDFGAASEAAGEGLRLAEVAGDDRWAARFCAWAGMVASRAGRIGEAVNLAARGIEHANACRDPRAHMLLAMLVSGLPSELVGRLMPRLPPIEELLSTAHHLDDSRYEPWVLCTAAGLALRDRDLRTTAARCAACLRLAQHHATWDCVPFALMLLALVAVRRKNYVEAALFHGMARARPEVLQPMPPSPWLDDYPAVISGVRVLLGDVAFETLARKGEDDMHVDPVAVALDYAQAAAGLARAEQRSSRSVGGRQLPEDLTPRERDVLVELTTGATNKQISARLGMTPKTVMHHSMAIYRKLGVRGRAEATAWAFRHGMAH